MEAHFLPTGSPELVARCEWLAQLASPTQDVASARHSTISAASDAVGEALTQALPR
jgi:hypothetical protein